MEYLTPRRIARWLRAYRDWLVELQTPGRTPAGSGGVGPPGHGAHAGGGPTAEEAARRAELEARCREVEYWLSLLTPLERLAARYWLEDGNLPLAEVAMAMGVEVRRARHLVRSIPLIIWGHLYQPPVLDENAMSS